MTETQGTSNQMPSKAEQIKIFHWFACANYKNRSDISGLLKNYYPRTDLLHAFERFVEGLTDLCNRKIGEDKCIQNAEICLVNCLKFDEQYGHLGMLVNIYFLNVNSISKFWRFAFCGKTMNLNIDNVNVTAMPQDPDGCIDALCRVLRDAARDDITQISQEYMNKFASRFLENGLRDNAKELSENRLLKLLEPISRFIVSIPKCHCDHCFAAFFSCCNAYSYFIAGAVYTNTYQVNYCLNETIIKLLDCAGHPVQQKQVLLLIKNIPLKAFGITLSTFMKYILDRAIFMAETIVPEAELLCDYIDTLVTLFNDVSDLSNEDPYIISRSLQFFYTLRYAKPCKDALNTILNSNLRNNIIESIIDEIIAEAGEEDDEEYIKLFTELKSKKRKLGSLVNTNILFTEIQDNFDISFKQNLSDIADVTPIVESCRRTVQNIYDNQKRNDKSEKHDYNPSSKNVNIFLEE